MIFILLMELKTRHYIILVYIRQNHEFFDIRVVQIKDGKIAKIFIQDYLSYNFVGEDCKKYWSIYLNMETKKCLNTESLKFHILKLYTFI